TSTVPIPAGEVAVIWVALLTVKEPAAFRPNLTAVAPEKLVPVMVTLVPPPDAGPVFGLTLVTAGGAGRALASPSRQTAHRSTTKTAPANGRQARRCITRPSKRSRSRPGWSLGGTICAPGGTTCATAANETLAIAKAAAMARALASMPPDPPT